MSSSRDSSTGRADSQYGATSSGRTSSSDLASSLGGAESASRTSSSALPKEEVRSESASLDRAQAVDSSNPLVAMQETVQMLQWFVREAGQLPNAQRLEALR